MTTAIDSDCIAYGLATECWIDLRDVVARCMGNLELAKRVVARFQHSLADTLRQLDLLAEREDWEQLARRVHRLKGEAGNVGCRPLAELASQVEEFCTGGQGESARTSLRQLAQAGRDLQLQELSLPGAASEFTTSRLPSVSPEIECRC